MKTIYDSVSDEYIYPLTKKDVRGIKDYVSSEILRLVRLIRFSCNDYSKQVLNKMIESLLV